jgi:predicted NBD/HSP70 family sugar kinase
METPTLRNHHRVGFGEVLSMVRDAGTITRSELIARSGLGRSTMLQRVDALLELGLVTEVGRGQSTGGRRPIELAFNAAAGLVFAADLGAYHARAALTDLAGVPVVEHCGEIDIAAGPDQALDWVHRQINHLLESAGRPRGDIRCIGVGVPGPVEFARGRPVLPPIMPGWDGFDIPQRLQGWVPVPVVVDNDVNIMALGEHREVWPGCSHLLFVKVATGIGCGIVIGGRVYRGHQGAAGDIGHIHLPDHSEVICECGNTGCLETSASGRALARQLSSLGVEAHTSMDVVKLVREQNRKAVRLVRQAGRQLGEVLATLVNALNPEVIVIGGEIAEAYEQLFPGVREIVYRRSTPLAARHLQIVRSALGERAGIIGAATMAIDHLFAPEAIDALLTRTPSKTEQATPLQS